MKTYNSRRRSIGLAAGSIWLIVISYVFIIWSLLVIGTPEAKKILFGSILLLFILTAIGIIIIRRALRLPKDTAERTHEEKKIGRRFVFIVGVEVLAFSIVNPILSITENYELMPSLNLIIVGIHFFPLALIFRVPRYIYTGLLFCIIPVITLVIFPKQFQIGQTTAWFVLPSLGCGIAAILTAFAGLGEAWKTVYKTNKNV